MKIEVINKISFKELEERIRSVPLNKAADDGQPIFAYKNADISLRALSTEKSIPQHSIF